MFDWKTQIEKKRLLVILFFLLGFELSVQIGVRTLKSLRRATAEITGLAKTSDKLLGWTFFGNHELQNSNGEKITIRFNSLGIRGPEINSRAELMFLGDSVTAGLEVSEEKTFSGVLGAINAGFPGYSTYQERDRFLRDLYQLKPRRLGLVVCANDFLTIEQNALVKRGTLSTSDHFSNSNHWWNHEALFLLKDFASAAWTESIKEVFYFRQMTREYPGSMWESWFQAVNDIKQNVKGAFFVVIVPPRIQVLAAKIGSRNFQTNIRIGEWAYRNNIQILDLLDPFKRNSKSLFSDFVHLNEDGHYLVAEEIRKFLYKEPELALRISSISRDNVEILSKSSAVIEPR